MLSAAGDSWACSNQSAAVFLMIVDILNTHGGAMFGAVKPNSGGVALLVHLDTHKCCHAKLIVLQTCTSVNFKLNRATVRLL